MSNYYCPRCGKAIIDIPWGESYHTCTPWYTGMTPAQSEFNNK